MKNSAVRWTVSYAAVQFFFWFAYGTALAYASPYLLACGLSNTAIGLINAAACTLSVVIQPALSAYADRGKSLSLKAILLIMTGMMTALTAMLVLMTGRSSAGSGLLLGLDILIIQLGLPLVNALATESMNAGFPLNFGLARGFGSIGYAVMSFSMGQLMALKGPQIHPLALMIFCICLMVSICCFPFKKMRGETAKDRAGKDTVASFVRRYPSFCIMLVGCVLIYVSHVLINNFVYQIVVAKGGGSDHMGIAMALAGILEIIPMLIFPWMLQKKNSGFWFKLAGIFFTLKALGTLLASDVVMLYLVQLIQPMGWGLLTVSSVYYVNEIMREQDRIKGQAYMTMSLSVATIIGSIIGGRLIDTIGVNGMLIAAVACGAAGTAIVWFRKKRG
ncbi:MAG: MFS transporter [Clostridia bacterium]|nr:MFS transporter [Clostridia bacterium]